jgi:hypothetical protein
MLPDILKKKVRIEYEWQTKYNITAGAVVAVVAALAEATLYSHPCAIRAGGNGK